MAQRLIFCDNDKSEVEKILDELGFSEYNGRYLTRDGTIKEGQIPSRHYGKQYGGIGHIGAIVWDRFECRSDDFDTFGNPTSQSRVLYDDGYHWEERSDEEFCDESIDIGKKLISRLKNIKIIDGGGNAREF